MCEEWCEGPGNCIREERCKGSCECMCDEWFWEVGEIEGVWDERCEGMHVNEESICGEQYKGLGDEVCDGWDCEKCGEAGSIGNIFQSCCGCLLFFFLFFLLH